MRTRETFLVIVLALVATAGAASAQDPTVNESDYDTTPPASDESYLDETESSPGDPTLSDGHLDTQPPAYDESYLDEGVPEDAAAKGAPGFGVALLAAAAIAAALARR